MKFSSDVMGSACDWIEENIGGVALFMNGGKKSRYESIKSLFQMLETLIQVRIVNLIVSFPKQASVSLVKMAQIGLEDQSLERL